MTIKHGGFRYMHSRTSRDPERWAKVDPNTFYSQNGAGATATGPCSCRSPSKQPDNADGDRHMAYQREIPLYTLDGVRDADMSYHPFSTEDNLGLQLHRFTRGRAPETSS